MKECYPKAIKRFNASAKQRDQHVGYSGMGSLANLAHHMFSVSGLTTALLGLVLIGALGFLSVGHLKRQANAIVGDTLPGLSMAGQANACMAQSFHRMLLLVVCENARERARIRREIDAYSETTGDLLASYEDDINEREDRDIFNQLKRYRMEYLKIRERAFSLIDSNKQQEALEMYERELLPAFSQYKETGDRLFAYNMEQGKARGQSIMRVCTITQWVVAGIGIFIFIAGFLFGLFK